jgi:hypothetical protein
LAKLVDVAALGRIGLGQFGGERQVAAHNDIAVMGIDFKRKAAPIELLRCDQL